MPSSHSPTLSLPAEPRYKPHVYGYMNHTGGNIDPLLDDYPSMDALPPSTTFAQLINGSHLGVVDFLRQASSWGENLVSVSLSLSLSLSRARKLKVATFPLFSLSSVMKLYTAALLVGICRVMHFSEKDQKGESQASND